MLDQLVLQPERLPSLMAGLALLGIAVWLLWFDLETRLHRAFALLLVLKAFFLGLLALGLGPDSYAGMVRMYFAIGLPFAALYFALLFHSVYSGRAQRRRIPLGGLALILAVLALAFLALFALRRGLYRDAAGNAGPFVLFLSLAYTSFAFIAFVFVAAALRLGPGRPRSAMLLGGFALALEPLYQATFQILTVPVSLALGFYELTEFRDPVWALERGAWLLAFAFFVPIVIRLLRAAGSADDTLRRDARRFLLAILVPLATSLSVLGAYAAAPILGGELFISSHHAVNAFWVIVAAGVVLYAIVHHHFLDVRPRLQRAMRTSTLIGALLLVFFVAKEILEEVIHERYPLLPGLGAAVIAVILLQPVLFGLARLVRALMPAMAPLSDLKKDARLAVYRSQVEIVWMDGVVSRKERRLLERMRERLEIPEHTAARIESDVMGGGTATGSPSPRG